MRTCPPSADSGATPRSRAGLTSRETFLAKNRKAPGCVSAVRPCKDRACWASGRLDEAAATPGRRQPPVAGFPARVDQPAVGHRPDAPGPDPRAGNHSRSFTYCRCAEFAVGLATGCGAGCVLEDVPWTTAGELHDHLHHGPRARCPPRWLRLVVRGGPVRRGHPPGAGGSGAPQLTPVTAAPISSRRRRRIAGVVVSGRLHHSFGVGRITRPLQRPLTCGGGVRSPHVVSSDAVMQRCLRLHGSACPIAFGRLVN